MNTRRPTLRNAVQLPTQESLAHYTMLWRATRCTPDECAANGAEPARQRSTLQPRSLILGLAAFGKMPRWRGPMAYAADRVTDAKWGGCKTAGSLASLEANAAVRNLAHKPQTRAASRRSASTVRP